MTIPTVTLPQIAKLKVMAKQLEVLNEANYKPIDRPLVEKSLQMLHWPLTVKVDVGQRIRDIEKEKIKFMELLAKEKKQYAKDFKDFQVQLEFVKTEMNDFEKAKEYDKKITGEGNMISILLEEIMDEQVFDAEAAIHNTWNSSFSIWKCRGQAMTPTALRRREGSLLSWTSLSFCT
jgi:hypothetical protein